MVVPGGADLARSPRLLDSHRDRTMVIDVGAYEFDNVHLEVAGDATPGGMLTVDTSRTARLEVLLLVGTDEGHVPFPPFGALFFDLASPWLILPWGTIPSSITGTIPASTPPGLLLVLEELAFALGTPSPGNTSNAAVLLIE